METKPYTRKLATIQKVQALHEIKGADFIEICQINGWQCITKKGEVKLNDLVVYFEIDSFLPDNDYFSFLPTKTTYEGKQGYRLKTIKLKKAISQGLVLPISHFKHHLSALTNMKEGDDVTEILDVIKYDNESQAYSGKPGMKKDKPRGSFPTFIPKTNQERIQNLTTYFSTLVDEEFEETLKLDGSSLTCYKIIHTPTLWERVKSIFGIKHKAYHFGVCSRNLELKPTANNKLVFDNQGKESIYDQSDFWTAAYKYKLEDKLPTGYAVQGELIGPKIQDNQEKVKELEFYCFDVYNIYTGDYLTPVERREFCATHNIPHVPVISEQAKPLQLGLEGLLKHVEGESMNPGTISEGRVYKHISKPITFKAISNKYLLGSEQ